MSTFMSAIAGFFVSAAIRIMVAVMFVVLWWADWDMVGHWDLFVDWEFHFFVDDMWSVDWNLNFILREEINIVIRIDGKILK